MDSRIVLLVLVATLALSGCGGDGGDGNGDGGGESPAQTESQTPAPAPAPSAAGDDPEAVFKAFQNALADGDAGTACGHLGPSAVRQVEEASIGGTCEDWVEELTGAYDEASQEKLRDTKVEDVIVSGDRATIKHIGPILEIPLEVELRRTDGSWRLSKLAEGV